MDVDLFSFCEVECSYGGFGVEVILVSICGLLIGWFDFGCFDFVYFIGFFDYFKLFVGCKFCMMMFKMLYFGGKLLIVNFLFNVYDIGYMEMFMDWFLIY